MLHILDNATVSESPENYQKLTKRSAVCGDSETVALSRVRFDKVVLENVSADKKKEYQERPGGVCCLNLAWIVVQLQVQDNKRWSPCKLNGKKLVSLTH